MKEPVVGDGEEEEEVMNLSIARGGPIYVSNMISPITSIPDFEAALLHELQVSASPVHSGLCLRLMVT